MSGDELMKLQAKKEYLTEWLARQKDAQDITPFVQQGLEVTEWEIQVLSDKPEEAEDVPLIDIASRVEHEYDFLMQSLPMIPEYDTNADANFYAVTTSGSASMYDYVMQVGALDTPNAQLYSSRYGVAYAELQTSHNRPAEARELINHLHNPQTVERFDRASNAYYAAKSGIGTRTAAALEMRNLLDGIQGDLFNHARRFSKENMTWKEMAARLAYRTTSGTEKLELIQQEATRSKLIERLSMVLKDREENQ